MPTNTMKNTRFSVRQTERLCTLSSLESSPTNSQKGIFRPSKPFFPSSRGILRTKRRKCLKSLYFVSK